NCRSCRRRVGKGASQVHDHIQANKHSAVPTRHRPKPIAQQRVGTAHESPSPWIHGANAFAHPTIARSTWATKQERRPMMARMLSAVLVGLSMGSITMSPANAQTVEQFYRGKTVTVLVGTSPGGINDITARFAAKHFGRFIPGNPLVNVQYTPGGGGLVTANRIYNASERDGTVLAKLERATPQLAVQGYPQAQFDPTRLVWLGSMSSYADDAYLMLINAEHP